MRHSENDQILFVPGLNDQQPLNQKIRIAFKSTIWQTSDLTVSFFPSFWQTPESLDEKLARLNQEINRLHQLGQVSLIGASAGVSLVLNAFHENADVNKVVGVYGRIKVGDLQGLRSLNNKAKSSPAFHESVVRSDQLVFSPEKLNRILLIDSKIGDELVPKKTSTIFGVHHQESLIPEHGIGIWLNLWMGQSIIDFSTHY